jgi:nucleotide sugar dehydrogenase
MRRRYSPLEINVVGVGVTGFATAEVLRRLGHVVRVYDANSVRQAELEKLGYLPMTPGEGEITCFCVPECNLEEALATAQADSLWVVRSSTRPGDIQAFQDTYRRHIIHLPEFLREATALWDALTPERIVIGECCQEHGRMVAELFAPLLVPIIHVDSTTSEMIKLVSNAHLSTLISFWNEIHQICQKVQINSTVVGKVVSMDQRISAYGAVMHGRPFSGFCLPKDLDSLISMAGLVSLQPSVLEAVRQVNEHFSVEAPGHITHDRKVRV